jgi:hypothetical protein
MNNELPLFHSSATTSRLVRLRSLRPAIRGLPCVPHADPADLARAWPAGMSAMLVFCPRHPRHPTKLLPIEPGGSISSFWHAALRLHPGAGLVVLSPRGVAYISGGFTIGSLDKTLLIAEDIARMRGGAAAPAANQKTDRQLETTYPNHNAEAAALILHSNTATSNTPTT